MRALLPFNKIRYPVHKIILRALPIIIAQLLFLQSCSILNVQQIPTAYPTEYLPTVIALTLDANRAARLTEAASAPLATPTAEQTKAPVLTAAADVTLTAASAFGETASVKTLQSALAASLNPATTAGYMIPRDKIEFRSPGPLSRVTSPITIYSYLRPGSGGQVQIELLGEDHRILVRQIKPLPYINRDGYATLYTPIDFQIPGTAEAGRLVLSVFDSYGRVTAVNSLPLLLISIGESDLIPQVDYLASIVIQQPQPKTLIQGNSLKTFGFARVSYENNDPGSAYLMLQLITPEGKIVGKRVTNVMPSPTGGHGTFMTEVPYEVSEPTSALLVVWEGEGGFSNIVHLTSIEVLLSP